MPQGHSGLVGAGARWVVVAPLGRTADRRVERSNQLVRRRRPELVQYIELARQARYYREPPSLTVAKELAKV